MRDQRCRHLLAELRVRMGGLSAAAYLARVDQHHRALGYGPMAVRREKVARWESGACAPELSAQLAMASLHQVPEHAVREWGWPAWLLLALPDDRILVGAPWTAEGTVAAMLAVARWVTADRRTFLAVTGAALIGLAGHWAAAIGRPPVVAGGAARRPTPATLANLNRSLAELRRLDDAFGGGALRRVALAEFEVLCLLAGEIAGDDAIRRQLFTTISEAARLCGWLCFDAGRHAAAEAFYITALRASATADDPGAGANALAFMAIQTYSIGNPHDAVNLMRTALAHTSGRTTPRVRAMLHVRAARALSKTSHAYSACMRELDNARDAYARGRHDDDPDWLYWLTEAELEMLAGSCALDLGRPQQALRSFNTAQHANFAGSGCSRDYTLYLTRAARAHLALGEIDHACATAGQALQHHVGVHSARIHTALADLCAALAVHRHTPAVRDVLDLFETTQSRVNQSR